MEQEQNFLIINQAFIVVAKKSIINPFTGTNSFTLFSAWFAMPTFKSFFSSLL